jgi:hypothetical protein
MRRFALAIAVAVAFVSGQSSAATINIEGVEGTWGSVVASGSDALTSGVGTSQLKWGRPAAGKKSGYGFAGLSTKNLDVGSEFLLGTFTHFNSPIASGTSIKETTMSLSINLLIDGARKSVVSAFKFLHDETPNLQRGRTCANGAKFGMGVNQNGCADKVTFMTVLELFEEFQIGDAIYTMEITGLLLNGSAVTEFWTKEKGSNSANLTARFKKVREVGLPPPPVPVPLPAPGLLLLAAIGGLAVAKRRAVVCP